MTQRERELLLGDGECTSPSPGGGPSGESFVSKNLDKRAVFSVSGSQEGMESHGRTNTGSHSSSSLASRQQQAVREHHQSPYSRTLCQTMEPGKCCTAHSDPSLVRPRAGSLHSTSLPHHGYVGGPTGPAWDENRKPETNKILTGTEPEPEPKSNFIVPNRIKKCKWPLTG